MKGLKKRVLALLLVLSVFLGAFHESFWAGQVLVAQAAVREEDAVDQDRLSQVRPAQNGYRELDRLAAERSVPPTEPKPIVASDMQAGAAQTKADILDSAEGWTISQMFSTLKDLASELEKIIPEMGEMAKGLTGVGGLLDLISIVSDVEGMVNPNNESSFWRTVECALLYLDMLMAMLSIANIFLNFIPGGFLVNLLLALLALLIGLLASWVHSEGFEDAHPGFKEWECRIKLPFGINILKPNIYLYYADSGTDLQVRFPHPELLTTTIPDYSGSWEVTNLGDGMLRAEDGREYGYLFYESVSSPGLFQQEEGYRIPASGREEAFRQILDNMGFNAREIHDFVEFWCEKLKPSTDYIMYPQGTPVVDAAMPIEIFPKPSSIERFWFAFREDRGQAFDTPKTALLQREGKNVVIEWGGMVF